MNSFGERIGRRAVLQAGIALGIELGLSGQALAQEDAASQRPKEGDLFVKVGDSTTTPLRPADLPLGARQTMAWPMDPADNTLRNGSRLNRVMLLRMDAEKLSPETKIARRRWRGRLHRHLHARRLRSHRVGPGRTTTILPVPRIEIRAQRQRQGG